MTQCEIFFMTGLVLGSKWGIFVEFVFQTWVQMGSKFSFSGFRPGFGIFLTKQVQTSGFLEGFELRIGSKFGDIESRAGRLLLRHF